MSNTEEIVATATEPTTRQPVNTSASERGDHQTLARDRPVNSVWPSLIAAAIAGTLALLGAIIGSYTAATLSVRNQRMLALAEKREQAYAQLMGHRVLLTQLYISALQTRIDFEFHHRRIELAKTPATSPHLQEIQRLVNKSEDYQVEMARGNRELFQTVGLVRTTFRRTPELDRLTQNIYVLRVPAVARQTTSVERELLLWREQSIATLPAHAEREYGEPIDALLRYLLSQLQEGVAESTAG